MLSLVTAKSSGSSSFPHPISILKPVKGVEENLAVNLESFFRLDYLEYELIFSVADPADPAVPVIEELRTKYPRVRSSLLIGEVVVGPNPKVNNLVRSYQLARYDWILISDSNIRAEPKYLLNATESFSPDTGIVTAIVRGEDPHQFGGWLEAVFLNTFYARSMLLAKAVCNPVVIGKSMLFRRSEAERFGGIETLGRYLAEDYMAGKAMGYLNLEVEIMGQPVVQPLGAYSFRAFWSRHLRWGRIRKSQAPLLFFYEPALSLWVSGAIGAAACARLFAIPFPVFMTAHVLAWLASDMAIVRLIGGRIEPKVVLAWFCRECLYLGLWLHIAAGNSVNWRGRKLTLAQGGLLKLGDTPKAAGD